MWTRKDLTEMRHRDTRRYSSPLFDDISFPVPREVLGWKVPEVLDRIRDGPRYLQSDAFPRSNPFWYHLAPVLST